MYSRPNSVQSPRSWSQSVGLSSWRVMNRRMPPRSARWLRKCPGSPGLVVTMICRRVVPFRQRSEPSSVSYWSRVASVPSSSQTMLHSVDLVASGSSRLRTAIREPLG